MLSLAEAAKLHGHLGPWLVVGYKAGLLARELLKPQRDSDMFCLLRIPLKIPFSCIADGVQSSAGCTLGKLSIVIEDSNDFVIEFTNRVSGRRITIKIRTDIVDKIRRLIEEQGLEGAARCIENTPPEEIFEIVIS